MTPEDIERIAEEFDVFGIEQYGANDHRKVWKEYTFTMDELVKYTNLIRAEQCKLDADICLTKSFVGEAYEAIFAEAERLSHA
jgi:hypothetical protein